MHAASLWVAHKAALRPPNCSRADRAGTNTAWPPRRGNQFSSNSWGTKWPFRCCLMSLSSRASKHFVHLLDGCCLCYLGLLQVEERVTCFDAVPSTKNLCCTVNTIAIMAKKIWNTRCGLFLGLGQKGKNGCITAKFLMCNTAKRNSNVPPCNRLPVT